MKSSVARGRLRSSDSRTLTLGEPTRCYTRGLTPREKKSKRCAVLGAKPNGHQGLMGNQGGGCTCYRRGSDLRQPIRKSTDVAALTDEL